MTTELVRYEAARAALAAAHSVDEVKDIRDKAMAMQVYAKQAKDTELIDLATDIRWRAERRAAQILQQMLESGQRQSRGQHRSGGPGRGHRKSKPQPAASTLSDLGVTTKQSSRWKKLAVLSEKDFEAKLAKAKGKATAVRVSTSPSRKAKKRKAAPQSNDPIQEECQDCNTEEERWQRSVGSLAGDAISMRAFLSREFGGWQAFKIPRELVTLAEQAAEAWSVLARELRERAYAKTV